MDHVELIPEEAVRVYWQGETRPRSTVYMVPIDRTADRSVIIQILDYLHSVRGIDTDQIWDVEVCED